MSTYLVLCSGFLRQGEHGRNADRQVETTKVIDLGLLGQCPDMRLLQVVELVFIGSSKMGNQASVVAGNDHTTAASGLGLVHAVLCANAGFVAGFLENFTIFVFANASNVHDGVVGEQVLLKIQVSIGVYTLNEKIEAVANGFGETELHNHRRFNPIGRRVIPGPHGQCSEQLLRQ